LKELVLKARRVPNVPAEALVVSPNFIAGKSVEEICAAEVWEGNRRIALREVFDVEGETAKVAEEQAVKVIGEAGKVRKLGYQMSSGLITVDGNAGMYLGEEMKGGTITVNGNAGSWVGTKMGGGTIEVKGNAGDFVGSSYRGSRLGMKNGLIVIHGNAGNEVGCWMRGGTIRVKGNSGQFPGMHMSDGTIFVEGDCGGRAGAQMTGGRVIVVGRLLTVLSSFSFEELRGSVKVGEDKVGGPFYLFTGDVCENGVGRLFVGVNRNPHLEWYKRFIETPGDGLCRLV